MLHSSWQSCGRGLLANHHLRPIIFLPTCSPSSSRHQLHTTPSLQLHPSAVMERRSGKRMRAMPEWKREKFAHGPWWLKPAVVMTSPLTKTVHPAARFAGEEERRQLAVEAASAADLPLDMEDPYVKDPKMCLLCPRRFASPVVPSYKNPKLLAQFLSPHTGRVYQSHITGLCSYMQEIVEKEVARSCNAGFLSTRVKDPLYLKDPPLFNPARPVKPNPY